MLCGDLSLFVGMLRCDQGTNFIGAQNELSDSLSVLDEDKLSQYLCEQGCDYIKFLFNPPAASHSGGVWERQIRTVRNVLSGLLQQDN